MSEAHHSVVTGGSGFIGTHLVRRLLADGEEVTIVDLRPPAPDLLDARVRWVNADIRDAAGLASAFATRRVSTLYHLAAMTGVRESGDKLEEYRSVNVEGTEVVRDAAVAHGVARIVYTSSSSVYGPDVTLPTSEEEEPHPGSPYGDTKLEGERLLIDTERTGTSVRVARLFTVYGPGGRPGMAIPRFIRAALDQIPVPLFGSRNTARDFTHVSDAVEGVRLLARSKDSSGITNIATGFSRTLGEVIEIIERETGERLPIEDQPAHPFDPPATHADISAARRLGFEPAIDLSSGLGRMIAAEARQRRELAWET